MIFVHAREKLIKSVLLNRRVNEWSRQRRYTLSLDERRVWR
jgi:hypothetical protein